MADLIITDDNWERHCLDDNFARGHVARDYEKVPYGAVYGAPAGEVPDIPMDEWPDLIADLERAKGTLKDIWADTQIGVWHQQQISYCHAFAAVMTIAIQRAYQMLPYVSLSASSIGGPVTGFRNAGAWIGEDLKRAVDFGASTTEFVPMLTTRKADFKPGWEENATKHKASEWTDLRQRDFKQQGSALLAGFAVSVGLTWWGHAVVFVGVKDLDKTKKATDHNRYGIEFLNSWGTDYGNGGFGILTGTKKIADEAYILRQIVV